jgi:hypothetical protein
MSKNMKVLASLALVVLGSVATAQPAAADESTDRYRTAMRDLVGLTDSWTGAMRSQVAAVAIKPELACAAEHADLVQHGIWLADDLEGSALAAPAAVYEANVRAGAGFRAMVDAAAEMSTACDGSTLAKATSQFEAGRRGYRSGIVRMRMWLFDFAVEPVTPIPVIPIR